MNHEHHKPQECLAHVVLASYDEWLGRPSPSGLEAFLGGARHRAEITAPGFPAWRIEGPLDEPEFYLPLIAATGHPTLSIKWATALELTYFSLAEGMKVLRERFCSWIDSRGFDTTKGVREPCEPPMPTPAEFWVMFARRPGMFLGSLSGPILHDYLAGMLRGGDWLGLPPLEGLSDIVSKISLCSRESYGSDFAAYRVYESDATTLLEWAGLVTSRGTAQLSNEPDGLPH